VRSGATEEGVWSAPGRVNLIGDHTDYNGGFALPFALPLRTTVRARRRGDRTVVARSAGHRDVRFELPGGPGEVDGWGAYVAGVAWALSAAGVELPGAELAITSDVPIGGGLSSSHSLECAVALALTGLTGASVERTELARIVQRAENDYVGAPTGTLDQMASLCSRADHLSFFDAREMTVEPIPCDLAAIGLELLVIDSRAPHQLTDGAYASRRSLCEEAARRLGVPTLREVGDADAALAELADNPEMVKRVRHVLTENTRVLACVDLLNAGRVEEIGPQLTDSHASMRDDFENTVAEVDLAVSSALGAGALGARMTGGGFGGSIVALVTVDGRPRVTKAVTAAFVAAGFMSPSYLAVLPSRGAGRDA